MPFDIIEDQLTLRSYTTEWCNWFSDLKAESQLFRYRKANEHMALVLRDPQVQALIRERILSIDDLKGLRCFETPILLQNPQILDLIRHHHISANFILSAIDELEVLALTNKKVQELIAANLITQKHLAMLRDYQLNQRLPGDRDYAHSQSSHLLFVKDNILKSIEEGYLPPADRFANSEALVKFFKNIDIPPAKTVPSFSFEVKGDPLKIRNEIVSYRNQFHGTTLLSVLPSEHDKITELGLDLLRIKEVAQGVTNGQLELRQILTTDSDAAGTWDPKSGNIASLQSILNDSIEIVSLLDGTLRYSVRFCDCYTVRDPRLIEIANLCKASLHDAGLITDEEFERFPLPYDFVKRARKLWNKLEYRDLERNFEINKNLLSFLQDALNHPQAQGLLKTRRLTIQQLINIADINPLSDDRRGESALTGLQKTLNTFFNPRLYALNLINVWIALLLKTTEVMLLKTDNASYFHSKHLKIFYDENFLKIIEDKLITPEHLDLIAKDANVFSISDFTCYNEHTKTCTLSDFISDFIKQGNLLSVEFFADGKALSLLLWVVKTHTNIRGMLSEHFMAQKASLIAGEDIITTEGVRLLTREEVCVWLYDGTFNLKQILRAARDPHIASQVQILREEINDIAGKRADRYFWLFPAKYTPQGTEIRQYMERTFKKEKENSITLLELRTLRGYFILKRDIDAALLSQTPGIQALIENGCLSEDFISANGNDPDIVELLAQEDIQLQLRNGSITQQQLTSIIIGIKLNKNAEIQACLAAGIFTQNQVLQILKHPNGLSQIAALSKLLQRAEVKQWLADKMFTSDQLLQAVRDPEFADQAKNLRDYIPESFSEEQRKYLEFLSSRPDETLVSDDLQEKRTYFIFLYDIMRVLDKMNKVATTIADALRLSEDTIEALNELKDELKAPLKEDEASTVQDLTVKNPSSLGFIR